MTFFITEKETEALLEFESRNLVLPDDSVRSHSTTLLVWKTFDYLVDYSCFTKERLIELAVMNAKETNQSFEQSFSDTVGYVNQHTKDICKRNLKKRIDQLEAKIKKKSNKK